MVSLTLQPITPFFFCPSTANLLFAFSTSEFPAWLAAYCIMGVGGVMVYISQFYLAAYFPGVRIALDAGRVTV